jgi:hypothetical protein
MTSNLELTRERSKLAVALTRWLRRPWVRKTILLVLYTGGLAFCFPWPVKSLPRETDRTISLGLSRETDRTISLGLPLLHRAAFDLVISAFQRVSFSAFAFLISAFPPMPI